MKRVAVFFDEPGENDYPFDDPEFRTSYIDLASLIADKGGTFFVVRHQSTYLGGNEFRGGWRWNEERFERVDAPITVDLIWNKGHFRPDDRAVILNERALEHLCTDKWETYTTFPDLHATTVRLASARDVPAAQQQLTTPTIVLKPQDGERGNGVIIAKREDMPNVIPSYPYLAQAFIDTKGGVPGLIQGMHDFRVIQINDDVACAYIRTPPPGKLIANVAQGGKEVRVDPSEIPAEVQRILQRINEHMHRFPKRIYSVDMGLDRDGKWKIIELNSKPGAPSPTSEQYPRYQSLLATLLLTP